jgi:hypothetical protein
MPPADTFERLRRRGFEKSTRLGIAKRRGASFIAIGLRTLNAVYGIAGHGVFVTKLIEQRRQRRQFAPDRAAFFIARLQIFAPGNDMGAGDRPQLFKTDRS